MCYPPDHFIDFYMTEEQINNIIYLADTAAPVTDWIIAYTLYSLASLLCLIRICSNLLWGSHSCQLTREVGFPCATVYFSHDNIHMDMFYYEPNGI